MERVPALRAGEVIGMSDSESITLSRMERVPALRAGEVIPIHPQRIPQMDIGKTLERQIIQIEFNNPLSLVHHLTFGDPQGGGGDGDGEVVDLYAIELVDVDFDGIQLFEPKELLPFQSQ